MARKKLSSARGRVATYARTVFGLLEARSFDNVKLAKICGLAPMSSHLSRKRAFHLIAEFAFCDAVNRAVERDAASKRKAKRAASGSSFYASREWMELRYRVLKAANGKCECCGATAAHGAVLHVDHIKPRSKFPGLALEFSNMQVLCESCNLGKSNTDDTDWRLAEYSDDAVDKLLRSF